MRSIIAGIALVLATPVASFSPVFADDPKPDFAIKTKLAEVSIFLDSKIKADAALVADCLAEGKAWADKNRTDAGKMRKDDAAAFKNGAWTFERKYQTRSVVARHYISVVRSDYMDTGGAHPNSNVDTILWDTDQEKRVSIRPFFKETADGGPTLKAILQEIILSLKADKRARDIRESGDMDWYKGLEPKLLKIGAVTLAPSTEHSKSSGLTFHFPPYAVGPYAEGSYVAFVPWVKLKPYLTPEGVSIFGGSRPKADDEDQQ